MQTLDLKKDLLKGTKFILLISKIAFTMLIVVTFSACTSVKNKSLTPFEALYLKETISSIQTDTMKQENIPLLTFSAYKLPLPTFSRIVSDKFNIGLVFSEELAEKTITAEIKRTDLKAVLSVISRQIGVDVIRHGNTFYIGKLRPEDRGILVRKIFGVSKEEISSMISPLLSTQGKANVTSDCVLVVADHEVVLKRCGEMIDYLDNLETPTWILQIYLVSLRKNNMVAGGLSTKSSGKISYDIQNNKLNFDDLKLESAFTFNNSNSYTDVFSSPMVLLRDGVQSVWIDGETVPIPKKTVLESGSVQTTGFDYVDCGFQFYSCVRQARNDWGNLDLKITLSEISSYVEGVPVVNKTSLSTNLNMQPEKLYLLGELSILKDAKRFSEMLNLSSDAGTSNIQVWGKIYRIVPDVKKEYPVYSPNDEK